MLFSKSLDTLSLIEQVLKSDSWGQILLHSDLNASNASSAGNASSASSANSSSIDSLREVVPTLTRWRKVSVLGVHLYTEPTSILNPNANAINLNPNSP